MSDNAGNISKRVSRFEYSPEFAGYSKIVINVGENDDGTTLYYEAGNDAGRTLEFNCPWGTQQMANNLLSSFAGFQYQPYEAEGGLVNPAAELGDAITVSGVYSGIYKQDITFGRLMANDISAPQEEVLDYEVPHLTLTNRELTRMAANTRAEFSILANQIAAKVSKTGGSMESFGWTLTEEGFILASESKTVFKCDNDGISIEGNIKARTGYIGSDAYGYTITDNAIYNGVTSMSDTEHTGIYLGTDGICLGKGAFKVDSAGNIYASSGTFAGTVYAGSIQYGGSAGTLDGMALTADSVSTGQCNWGIRGGVAGGFYASDVFNGAATASYGFFNSIRLNGGNQYNGTIRDKEGNTVNVVRWYY